MNGKDLEKVISASMKLFWVPVVILIALAPFGVWKIVELVV